MMGLCFKCSRVKSQQLDSNWQSIVDSVKAKGLSINNLTLPGGGGLRECDDLWCHYVIWIAFMWYRHDQGRMCAKNCPKFCDIIYGQPPTLRKSTLCLTQPNWFGPITFFILTKNIAEIESSPKSTEIDRSPWGWLTQSLLYYEFHFIFIFLTYDMDSDWRWSNT
jgi:hypothetical protein